MRDDELLATMWRAFQAAEHVGHPDGPMAAILAVVRAHDRDATRCPNCDHLQLQLGELRAELAALRARADLIATERERAEKAEAEVERRESALHLAIMFAVGQLNLSAPAATCLLARSARDKLRQALVDYADAARGES